MLNILQTASEIIPKKKNGTGMLRNDSSAFRLHYSLVLLITKIMLVFMEVIWLTKKYITLGWI